MSESKSQKRSSKKVAEDKKIQTGNRKCISKRLAIRNACRTDI